MKWRITEILQVNTCQKDLEQGKGKAILSLF